MGEGDLRGSRVIFVGGRVVSVVCLRGCFVSLFRMFGFSILKLDLNFGFGRFIFLF